jgi:hypothetical protein
MATTTKKAPTAKTAKKAGKKGKKATEAPAPAPVPAAGPKTASTKAQPDIGELESALIARYPHVVAGTLLLAGDPAGSERKRTVCITCCVCGSKDRRVATSDLFQSRSCHEPSCKKAARQLVKEAAK